MFFLPSSRLWKAFVILILSLFTVSSAAFGQTGPSSPWKIRESEIKKPNHALVVKFKDHMTTESKTKILKEKNVTAKKTIEPLNVQVVEAGNPEQAAKAMEQLSQLAEVEYVEPVRYVKVAYIPNDPLFPEQWSLTKVEADKAWDVVRDAHRITIAIIDSGIDRDHPDLQGRLVGGWNFDSMGPDYNTDNTDDDLGHGTHVAGIAAAASDNGEGVASISFNARIMPVKVINQSGYGTYEDVAAGIIWAADHGAKVINMSFAGQEYSRILEDAINYAFERGCLLVAAAGNEGSDVPLYPAALKNVMAVGATDGNDERTFFSSYGSHVSVMAPGWEIISTVPGEFGVHYFAASGTSMASPVAAGIAAVAFAQDAKRTPREVRGIIEDNADDIMLPGQDAYSGHGRVNLYRVVTGGLKGKVIHGKSRLPIENARVEVWDGKTVVASTHTNAQGEFELRLKEGKYLVRVAKEGIRDMDQKTVHIRPGYTQDHLDWKLH